MKDSEFIALLNLYLDHEIAATDAARLEAEVQSNPDRRRVYQDYCRMQKACKILAQDFAEESADAPGRKVIAFTDARAINRSRAALYVGGTLAAAAACVALVFVTHGRAPEPAAPAAPATVAATPAATRGPAIAQDTTGNGTARRGLARQSFNALSLRNGQGNTLTLAAANASDPHFEWLQDVRLTPIQAPMPLDQVRLEAASRTLKPQDRTYSSSQPLPRDVQWDHISFSFQK